MLKNTVIAAVNIARTVFDDLLIDGQVCKRDPWKHVPGVTPKYTEQLANVRLYMSRYSSREVDNDRIMATDYRALVFPVVATDALIPNAVAEVDDHIAIGNIRYRVMRVDHVMAGTSKVMSEVQMRL